jgi:hypothetical protein
MPFLVGVEFRSAAHKQSTYAAATIYGITELLRPTVDAAAQDRLRDES